MNGSVFEFERPLVELERKIQDLRELSRSENLEMHGELKRLEERAEKLRREIYQNLTRWQRVQLARHPRRPFTLDYIPRMTADFMELHGDRLHGDDRALIGGPALMGNRRVMIIGHQKGRDTRENLDRNFGMAHPEGYRKSLRLMQMAARFRMPIVTLIDTPGAYPGIGAEERGQSEAIARNLFVMSRLPVPIVVCVIGEGGSGGALAIGVGDRVLMMEYSIYSVISPEGCAAILWNDRAQAPRAAEALRITAPDLLELEIIDEIVPEPAGGAHRDPDAAARMLSNALDRHLAALEVIPRTELLRRRLARYGRIGAFTTGDVIAAETEAAPAPDEEQEFELPGASGAGEAI